MIPSPHEGSAPISNYVRHSWGGAGPLLSFVVGCVHHSWGGAGPLSLFVGGCWAIDGICRGGAGPGSSSQVVMGHCLGGWWWALVAICVDTLPLRSIVVVIVVTYHCHPSIVVMLCWVKIGQQTMIVCHSVAMSHTWHLVLRLAISKGEGGLTLSLFIIWWPCHRL